MTTHPDPQALDAIALELARASMPFDICCTATLPEHGAAGRCQLWVDHEGDHAVMYVHNNERLVRTWHDARPTVTHDHRINYLRLPWARGFPLPGWRETTTTDG